ncbi:hypothetical protein [Corynebacterium caspium]|uniref:hypothetical protein n=1 Tax=Corynebacterium caspium TaxID=234828 RepID=UPI0003802B0E|nr:hypothetical protein [Corynebacterium caspium]WKD59683.1 hypothetical protein CCASP_06520 [Corynebacterium caspium DSM 44850]
MSIPLRPLATILAATALGGGLIGCSTTPREDATASTSSSVSASDSTTATSTSSSASTTETAGTGTETSESNLSSTAATTTELTPAEKRVAEVAKRFETLAPQALFEKLETCNPNSIENSVECSGPEVGQFQFFDSESKAASSTQLLTELRSSRVVEDRANHIVGWTTLGNNAVVTVVDTDKGQVLQQMISTDRVEPEDRIRELGLKGFYGPAPKMSADSTNSKKEASDAGQAETAEPRATSAARATTSAKTATS